MKDPAPCGTKHAADVIERYAVVWHALVPIVAVFEISVIPKLVPLRVTIVPAVAGELFRSTTVMTGELYENNANPVPT